MPPKTLLHCPLDEVAPPVLWYPVSTGLSIGTTSFVVPNSKAIHSSVRPYEELTEILSMLLHLAGAIGVFNLKVKYFVQ